jgi:hypothetical protein
VKENFDRIRRFNFWDSTPKLGFIRKEYQEWLMQFDHSKLVKVLVGQRRVGKSYILRQYIQHLIDSGVPAEQTLYINTEYLDFDFLRDEKNLNAFIQYYKSHFGIQGKFYLFIDEVQQIKNWERIVNDLSQDFTQEVNICISGSNSKLLSSELSSLLSGRYVEKTVYSFSYEEHLAYLKKEPSRKTYLEYLKTGGLPELFHLPNDETKRNYLSALRDTIVLRDIVQRHQVKDPILLMEIFAYLSNNLAVLTSVTNLIDYWNSKKRKTTYETVANYIDYFRQTYLIHQCERFDIKGKELLGGQYKYYLNDLSFVNYLFSGNQQGLGRLLENLVYLQLKSSGFAVYVGYMRDREVDFVAKKNDKTIYVQVAYQLEQTSTLSREINALLAIKDNFEKWIVTMDETVTGEHQGIKMVQVWELENKLKSI